MCICCHLAALRCPPGKEYQPCVSTCTSRTCLNREYYEETTCSFIREECVCRPGTILHRADSPFCVTEDRCGQYNWQCINFRRYIKGALCLKVFKGCVFTSKKKYLLYSKSIKRRGIWGIKLSAMSWIDAIKNNTIGFQYIKILSIFLFGTFSVCTDNEGNPRAPGEVWNGSVRGCCLYRCMENGSVVSVEPDCHSVPTPLCEREGEYVLDVLEEGACCPKKICGQFKCFFFFPKSYKHMV